MTRLILNKRASPPLVPRRSNMWDIFFYPSFKKYFYKGKPPPPGGEIKSKSEMIVIVICTCKCSSCLLLFLKKNSSFLLFFWRKILLAFVLHTHVLEYGFFFLGKENKCKLMVFICTKHAPFAAELSHTQAQGISLYWFTAGVQPYPLAFPAHHW